jgi:hypothetical protein
MFVLIFDNIAHSWQTFPAIDLETLVARTS